MNDLSKLQGSTARVFFYMLSHKLLVVEFRPQIHTLNGWFLLCGFTVAPPQVWSWTVTKLEIHKISDSRTLVCDVPAGVSIQCGSIQWRDSFDILHYLGGERSET